MNDFNDLAAKTRVHELAKRFGITSRALFDTLAEQGVVLKSSSSSVPAAAAQAALRSLSERGLLTLPAAGAESHPAEAEPAESQPAESQPAESEPAEPELTAPALAAPAESVDPYDDLPARSRVHELAKRAGITAKQLIAVLTERGITAKSASSVIAKPVAIEVLTSLLEPADVDQATPAPADDAAADLDPDQDEERRPRRRRGRRSRGRATDQAEDAPDNAEPDVVDSSAAPVGEAEFDHSVLFQAAQQPPNVNADPADEADEHVESADAVIDSDAESGDGDEAGTSADAEQTPVRTGRRRRRRGGRGSDRPIADAASGADDGEEADGESEPESESDEDGPESAAGTAADNRDDGDDGDDAAGGTTARRRRRRRRGGSDETGRPDDPADTVVHVRENKPAAETQVQGIRGSTRLEAKRQRRRDSLQTRRRPQILTEAEFLARRESVHRVMAVRQRGDLTQVAVLEDNVLVEHFVSRAGSASMIGNVYLGRVQNVLPSMEAAFVDIGRGRNAVLYAGEVNWEAAGLAGKSRKIETALKSGDTVLVQVSKDPVGHKGARLTTQLSLPGRFLVYVPAGGATGISRKLPDTERRRLKAILDRIVPDDAGVIIRTAAEGVSEEELARDVERLQQQWSDISAQAAKLSGSGATKQLYGEPDTLIKVIRDLFNSDISELIIDGDDDGDAGVWESLKSYVDQVAPELAPRVHRFTGINDVFAAHRIDEQIAKALERKVYLPSGGSLVIDRTEAMTVIDVNTGKYTGSGGNLEETVTKNNLEAAEEVVRQLRLRDIGGIIVVDFIDMVLESNRELVLRRLTECLGRDRTRHQVAEVTSLGLIQMTRKKMGTGLVEAFSEPCEHCHGRGIVLRDVPIDPAAGDSFEPAPDRNANRRPRGRGRESAIEVEAFTTSAAAPALPPVPPLRRDPRGPKPPDFVAGAGSAGAAAQPTPEPATSSVTELSSELIAELNGLAVEYVDEAGVNEAGAEPVAIDADVLESLLPVDPTETQDGEQSGPRRRRRGGRGKSRRDATANGDTGQPVADDDADADDVDAEGAGIDDLEAVDAELVLPEVEDAVEPAEFDEADGLPEVEPPSEEAPVEEAPDEEAPVEEAPVVAVPAPPRRRRSAQRPAGPPQVAASLP